MRLGQNPAKSGIKSFKPANLGIALLSYIPNQEGYFSDALKILEIQIQSIRKHTSGNFNIFVFDNGSSIDVHGQLVKLQQDNKIDWLFLSRMNLGKAAALNWIFTSMPNEWICYSDSDVFFREGWLEASMRIHDSFPNVGVVTGQPVFFENLPSESKALLKARSSGIQIARRRHSEDITKEYALGIGADEALFKKLSNSDFPALISSEGKITAFSGSCHMQFLAKKAVIRNIFPLPANFALSTEEDREFDFRLDQSELLRLSTDKPFVFHMGNRIDPEHEQEIESVFSDGINIGETNSTLTHKKNLLWRLLVVLSRNALINRMFKRLYLNLFELYSLEKK
jgi:glycosyltransferase involved in cell wall biosynthesis